MKLWKKALSLSLILFMMLELLPTSMMQVQAKEINTNEVEVIAEETVGENDVSEEVVSADTAVADTDAAKIGDTGYATLAKAISAVKDGETIVLLKDVTETIYIHSGKFSIDLNSHTLTGNLNADAYNNDIVCTVKNGTLSNQNGGICAQTTQTGITSTLNITDCNIVSPSGSMGMYSHTGGTLVLTNVTTDANCSVNGTGGALVINGGRYEGIVHPKNATSLTIDEQAEFSNLAIIEVKESLGPNKAVLKKDNGYYVIKNVSDEECTARIGNTHYYSLQQAVCDAKPGDTVTLKTDVLESDDGKNGAANICIHGVTVDMNHHLFEGTIRAQGDYYSGTENNEYAPITTTIKNYMCSSVQNSYVMANKDCVVNLYDVDQPEGTKLDLQGPEGFQNGGEFNIYSGTYNGNSFFSYGIEVNVYGGDYNGILETYNQSQTNIYGGDIDFKHIYMFSTSNLNLRDGEYNVPQIETNESSKLNIYDGTYNMGYLYLWSASSVKIYGGDFVIGELYASTDEDNAKLEIYDGTFDVDNAEFYDSDNLFIYGGTYTAESNDEIVDYVADGYKFVENEDGTYTGLENNTYTVKFNGNGSTAGTVENMKGLLQDTSYDLTENAFSRTGYTFAGWNTKADGTGDAYLDKESITNLVPEETVATLYAQWKANKYTISFSGNGNTNNVSMKSMSCTYNDDSDSQGVKLTANAFSKKGYTFTGWKCSDGKTYANGATVKNLSAIENGKVTMTAIWSITPYTITYTDGGKHSNPSSYNINTAVTLKNPTKAGYKFIGWYSDSKFKNKVTGINKGTVGNKVFYAKWSIYTYQVTYDLKGGKQNAKNPTSYKVTSNVALQNPTRKGYTFKGWFKDSNYKTQITNLKGNTGNLKLYAKWQLTTYKITYNLNSGKQNSKNPATYKMTSSTITLQNPSRKGYTFKGWYSDSKYKTQVKTINKGSTGNKTLYAKWAINTYKITYNLNGGKQNSKNPSTYKITTSNITLQNPSKRGCTFKGWYSDSKYKTQVKTINKGTTGNKTLYAKWSTNTYKITYNLNGGTQNSKNPATYKVTTATITLQNPSRKGYTFKGWYSDSKYKTQVKTINKNSVGNKTLYARWSTNKYTVIFNGNGNKSGSMKNQGFTYNKAAALTANAFKKTGYSFVGWNTKKDGTGTTYANKASVKNLTSKANGTVTLYAKWQKTKYTITYNGANNADADVSNANPTAYYMTSNAISFKSPTKIGYTFKGWYADSKYKTPIKSITKGSTGNKTIYAKWTVNSYNIAFNKNSEDALGSMNNMKCVYSSTYSLTGNAYTREGYNFMGWNTKADGSGNTYSNQQSISKLIGSGTIILYAQWEQIIDLQEPTE